MSTQLSPFLSIAEARRQLVSGKISPLELLEELEKRISNINPQVKAYLS